MIKNSINNNTLQTNTRKCHCINCGNALNIGEGVKVYTRNTYGYMCYNCKDKTNGGYATENGVFVNHQTKTNKCTVSIELEISSEASNYIDEEAFQYLINEAKFLKTPDCTVWAEMKSPIYNNLLGLSKVLSNFEKLAKLENWNNAEDYGTHLNIGNKALTEENLEIIRRFYHSLFVPFCDYLRNNIEKTEAIYGRNFTYYAHSIDYNTDVYSHSNFINMQHNTHIEFRLCKLINARQYMLCARLHQDIIQKVIVDYFLARYNEADNAAAKRKLAKKASEKMIKIFDKYYQKLINE